MSRFRCAFRLMALILRVEDDAHGIEFGTQIRVPNQGDKGILAQRREAPEQAVEFLAAVRSRIAWLEEHGKLTLTNRWVLRGLEDALSGD